MASRRGPLPREHFTDVRRDAPILAATVDDDVAGLYLELASHREDWVIYRSVLQDTGPEGRWRLERTLAEMRRRGMLAWIDSRNHSRGMRVVLRRYWLGGRRSFVRIRNGALRDRGLSRAAKATLVRAIAARESWTATADSLATLGSASRGTARKRWAELVEAGYASHTQDERHEDGTLGAWVTHVTDDPQLLSWPPTWPPRHVTSSNTGANRRAKQQNGADLHVYPGVVASGPRDKFPPPKKTSRRKNHPPRRIEAAEVWQIWEDNRSDPDRAGVRAVLDRFRRRRDDGLAGDMS